MWCGHVYIYIYIYHDLHLQNFIPCRSLVSSHYALFNNIFSLFGIGRFLALEETIYNCTEAKGWFLVVDTDAEINCQCDYCKSPNITVPYFIYAPNGLSSRVTSKLFRKYNLI